ncbi:MAG: type II toxin-antitoxin system ParD family antitoxin [Gammaproteobacteria bacterium]|nr:type II toxin-antitoxin system ParD family antitoxin [Gammaproteobacteria bacterium]
MPARNSKSIALTSKWTCWVDELVASGEYQSASEVVRDGLRALHDDRQRRATELAEIRARLELALAEAEAGKFADGTGEAAVQRAFERARGDASAS